MPTCSTYRSVALACLALGATALVACTPPATHLGPFLVQARLGGLQSPTWLAMDATGLWTLSSGDRLLALPLSASGHPRDLEVAHLSAPGGLAVAPDGTLFFSDTTGNRVWERTPAGRIRPFAGTGTALLPVGDGGQALSAQLDGPTGLAYDARTGTLFIADTGNHRVRAVDRTGTISTVAGTGEGGETAGGTATSVALTSPTGLAWEPGALAISDPGQERVFVLKGNQLSLAAGSGTAGFAGDGGVGGRSTVNDPLGLTYDASGDLFVADAGNGRVRAITPSGGISSVATGLATPWGLAASGSVVMATEQANGQLVELSP